MFDSAKTTACKRGRPMPIRDRDKNVCALKWHGFYLTENEMEEGCVDTALMYASAVLATSVEKEVGERHRCVVRGNSGSGDERCDPAD